MTDDIVFNVCIPHTKHDSFDYLFECSTQQERPVIGARVWVPFRNKNRIGVIIGENISKHSNIKLKAIIEVIDKQALLSESILSLCQWISRYYQSPLSEVIPLAIPKKLRQEHAIQLPINPSVQSNSNDNSSSLSSHPILLNKEQLQAIQTINNHQSGYQCFLLHGVTGSGKTQVYLHVIAQVLASDKQVLVLVPEIGLTPQLSDHFRTQFNKPMAIIHSNLNETDRVTAWAAARANLVKLVIGTRSAMFTPMPSLGLIIIDEEHDCSLKQMNGVRYSARDSALMRAYQANIPIILGSATPSLESIHNCNQKKYMLLRLNHKALTSTPLQYEIIDLRNRPMQHGLSNTSITLIDNHLKNNNQVLVFINRRGFAPILLCHSCGWMVDCRACDSHLTIHSTMNYYDEPNHQSNYLICHHCGLTQPIPITCIQCQSKELIPVGTGTQRIHAYLQHKFPDVKLLLIDRDTVRKKNEFNTHLKRINRKEVQLIIGTQMLAKGHHFPNLTLVVIVDVDFGFYNQDFRAIEQLGQLLIQVAGRAGRAKHPGQVVIQTHFPKHPLLNTLLLQGYDAFAKTLLALRKDASLPPYHYLAVIHAEDSKSSKIIHLLEAMKHYLLTHSVYVLGPAPAPLARKANQYRMQLLLKSPSRNQLYKALSAMREWLTTNKQTLGVRWNVDVDPLNLL